MSTLLNVLNELDALIAERDALRERVAELEYQRQYGNRAKLGKGEVETIRSMRRAGYKLREIADTFDVNKSTVSRIVRGQIHR